jgi:hypothetical protein
MTTYICSECGCTFEAPACQRRKYCSRACYGRIVSRNTFGKPKSAEVKAKISGPNHYNWKGGITKRSKEERFGEKYRVWQHAVFQRDNYTCAHCGYRNTRRKHLHAHHVKSWSEFTELRFDVSNGTTLCRNCHEIEHGKRPFLQEQPCACGCGKIVSAFKVSEGVRYLPGHSKAHFSEEAIRKRNLKLRGIHRSAETRARMSAARKLRQEKPHTEEHKRKVGETMRAYFACHSPPDRAGEANGNSKLTADDAREIRQLFTDGANRNALSRQFGVSWTEINRIVKGENWKDV